MRSRLVTHLQEPVFGALADPTRRAVLDLLRVGPLPAGAIARQFAVSRPAISKHLGILRRARIVREQRQGRMRFYHLNAEPLRAVDSWLERYRGFWQSNLATLKTFVESEYSKKAPARRKRRKRKT